MTELREAIVFHTLHDGSFIVGPIGAKWPVGKRIIIPAGGHAGERPEPQEAEVVRLMPDGAKVARAIDTKTEEGQT